jgi:hypothetical protein
VNLCISIAVGSMDAMNCTLRSSSYFFIKLLLTILDLTYF